MLATELELSSLALQTAGDVQVCNVVYDLRVLDVWF